ncbi:MAG TPA: ABC transporter permease [Candidatus Elarobacter sp.]|jgi:putative ABC transport system permease protein|nr:ABC transporter permease [Candidatus Elarobacter sp.]
MIAYVAEALAMLRANPMRTILTLIGLVIGVTAVIAIEVAGAGLSGAVGGTLGSFSDRSFTILPQTRQGDFERARIKYDDVVRGARAVPNIAVGIPFGANTRLVRVGRHHARLQVAAGVDSRYETTALMYGRGIAPEDVADAAHVAVLSARAYERFFPDGGDPTGQSARIGDRRYVIVGIQQKPAGRQINLGRGDVAIPSTTYARDLARGDFILGATFFVDDVGRLASAESAMTEWFRTLKKGRVEYTTIDKRALSKGIDGIFGVLTFIVAVIGAVSLVVAGIGILNIMLVSVTERTREIGLRKAIGATRSQVLLQFFIEALALSAIGCAVGLALGVAIGALVNGVFLVKISGIVPQIPWLRSIVIATGFATVVTLAFGTYPAWRAATLDPIEALRYE